MSKESKEELKEKIKDYLQEEALVEQERRKHESYRWDMKFQNYWSYQTATLHDFQSSLNMCEKIFKHVGRFRRHAEKHFKHIIDNLHI